MAADALKDVQLPPMRMEIRHLLGATFVVDTYNASPPAMIASLEALTEMPTEGRRIAILGHMRELGDEAVEAHREVGRALGRAALDAAILYGPMMDEVRRGAIAAGMDAGSVELVDSLEDVKRKVSAVRAGDTVLVKGSRAMELERALEGLA
ncbi:hypothetical protein EON77_07920 [bacterium]|nr:MAG: hypothetical protein EON77_07920 [bacterium]